MRLVCGSAVKKKKKKKQLKNIPVRMDEASFLSGDKRVNL